MREILFRGKRIDNGEWVEGFFCNKTCDSVFSPMYEQANIIKKGIGYWYPVIPNTVGQYTGLTDKNGKRIFEGDILRAIVREMETKEDEFWGKNRVPTGNKKEAFWTVEWKSYSNYTGFLVYGKDRRFHHSLTYNVLWNCNAEVIGNIHDNPEMLKGDKHDTNT